MVLAARGDGGTFTNPRSERRCESAVVTQEGQAGGLTSPAYPHTRQLHHAVTSSRLEAPGRPTRCHSSPAHFQAPTYNSAARWSVPRVSGVSSCAQALRRPGTELRRVGRRLWRSPTREPRVWLASLLGSCGAPVRLTRGLAFHGSWNRGAEGGGERGIPRRHPRGRPKGSLRPTG